MPRFQGALEFARSNNQLAVWDTGDQSCLLAVWHDELQAIVSLKEDQALPILATNPDIDRECRKWRAITGKPGRLIIVDEARCQALLARLEGGSLK